MTGTLDYLALTLTPDVRPCTVRALRERAPIADILAHPGEHADLLSPRAAQTIAQGEARRRAERQSREAERRGFEIVGLDDPPYPRQLKEIHDPPPVLYVWGRLVADEGWPSVAVVGSRAASPQGLALARQLGREIAASGVTVVSGLARGIDAEAHLGALEVRGRCVAVLGSGLDNVYPWENAPLAQAAVASGGAVVSEFPFGTEPWKGNFPRRNRIIAGWGPGVVVVEAAERSGALVTARLALDEGREVLAVPGHPFQEGAAGTNQLIRDGAALVRTASDVLSELGMEEVAVKQSDQEAEGLLQHFERDVPCSVEELQVRSGWPAALVLSRLTDLELSSRVRRGPGSLYVRN